MSKRSEHTFQFKAFEIAEAAAIEAAYHEERLEHWQHRSAEALVIVRETVGAKITERHVTGGTEVDVVVDYGDPEAWREYQTAFGKIRSHREAAERYRTDQRVYETQNVRVYELDTDDVHHFRLSGEPRED